MASEREIEATARAEWIKMLDLARRDGYPVVVYTRTREYSGRVKNIGSAVVELVNDRRWVSVSLLVVQAVEMDMRDGR